MNNREDKEMKFDYSWVPKLRTKLLDGQEKTLMKCYNSQQSKYKSCILAENCGSGKTLTTLVTMEMIRQENDKILVVAPISAIESWENDCKTHFSPSIPYITICSGNHHQFREIDKKNSPIVIISYSMLSIAFNNIKNNRKRIVIERLNELNINFPKTTDLTQLTNDSIIKYHKARRECNILNKYLEYYEKLIKSRRFKGSNILKPLPFDHLIEKEIPRNTTILNDCLYLINWKALIVDEAHKARNDSRAIFNSLINVNSEVKFMITATPCNNSIRDLISLLKIMHIKPPNGWSSLEKGPGSEYSIFLNNICSKLFVCSSLEERDRVQKKFNIVEVIVYSDFNSSQERYEYDNIYNVWKDNYSNKSKKSTNFPSSIEINDNNNNINNNNNNEVIVISSDSDENEVDEFDKIAQNEFSNIELDQTLLEKYKKENLKIKKTSNASNILAIITKLRQCCDSKSKVNSACNYIEQRVFPVREKAVIYTCFVKTVDDIANELRKRFSKRIHIFQITGKVKRKKRMEIIRKFSSSRMCCILIATITTINLGVNLHEANHALMIDVWWNPMVGEQAVYRIARPQQTRSLFWVYFVTKHSVEESIWLVMKIKSDLNRRVISGNISEDMLNNITSKSALTNKTLTFDNDYNNVPKNINKPPLSKKLLDPIIQGENGVFLNQLSKLNFGSYVSKEKEKEEQERDILKPNQISEIKIAMLSRCNILLESGNDFSLIPETKKIIQSELSISMDKSNLIYVLSNNDDNNNNNNNNNNDDVIKKRQTGLSFIKRNKFNERENKFLNLRTKNSNLHHFTSSNFLLNSIPKTKREIKRHSNANLNNFLNKRKENRKETRELKIVGFSPSFTPSSSLKRKIIPIPNNTNLHNKTKKRKTNFIINHQTPTNSCTKLLTTKANQIEFDLINSLSELKKI